MLLDPSMTVEQIDAIVLAGGSAFGLDAAAGVQAWLAEQGRGFAVRDVRVPIVPGAILFDLLNGGDKDWGRFPPYRELGYAAAAAAGARFKLGTAGAGFGATTANLKGGTRLRLGDASATSRSARWSRSMPRAASPSATGRGSGRRRSSATPSSAGTACPRRCPPTR